MSQIVFQGPRKTVYFCVNYLRSLPIYYSHPFKIERIYD